jgi:hypothetical protein
VFNHRVGQNIDQVGAVDPILRRNGITGITQIPFTMAVPRHNAIQLQNEPCSGHWRLF